jgi:hypothetical protein
MKVALSHTAEERRVGALVWCVVLGLFACLFLWFALAEPDRASLREIDGVVRSVDYRAVPTESVTILQQRLLVDDGHHVYQLRGDGNCPLEGIRPGDAIQVLAKADLRGFFWIWELRQQGTLLLSYEQSLNEQKRSNWLFLGASLISIAGALTCAIRYAKLRRRRLEHSI